MKLFALVDDVSLSLLMKNGYGSSRLVVFDNDLPDLDWMPKTQPHTMSWILSTDTSDHDDDMASSNGFAS